MTPRGPKHQDRGSGVKKVRQVQKVAEEVLNDAEGWRAGSFGACSGS